MVYATTSRMPQRCRYLVALGFRGGDLGYLKYLGSTKSFYLHSLIACSLYQILHTSPLHIALCSDIEPLLFLRLAVACRASEASHPMLESKHRRNDPTSLTIALVFEAFPDLVVLGALVEP
jgi:hypothetical protein